MEILNHFAPATVQVLKNDMAPLMQWVYIRDHVDAYEFDLLVTIMQTELLNGSSRFDDFKDRLLNWVAELLMHLNPVREKADMIKTVKSSEFWEGVTAPQLETVRRELRGIMHHRLKETVTPADPRIVDVTDGDIEYQKRSSNVREIDVTAYKHRVREVLELFATNPTLQKIRNGQAVSRADLNALTSLVLTQNPDVDLNILKEFYEAALPLDHIIRSIVGMNQEAVRDRFAEFVHHHPKLSAKQILFLNLLQNHIAKYSAIELDRLYEAPFTTVHSEGLDGVFTDEEQIDELLTIIQTFQPHSSKETANA